MNLKTTILLLVIAGGCVALFWKGPELAPRLGLAPEQVSTADSGTFKTLANLPVDQITRIEIDVPGQPKLVLQGSPLELPGNWPIRRSEVDQLLQVLHDLKSRYYPIDIGAQTDLKPYGLAAEQKPTVVTITTAGGAEKLKFGEAPMQAGENPFTRATYVRLEGKNEVLRLGPQVLPVLRRDEEAYRRRQLFPEATRARVVRPKRPSFPGMEEPEAGSAPTFLLSDAVAKIEVAMPSGHFTLERVAPMPKPESPASKRDADADSDPVIQPAKLTQAWQIAAPVHDRLDPEKASALLTAIPNLWLEKFVKTPDGRAHGGPEWFFGLGEHADATPKLLTLLGGGIPTGLGDTPLRAILNYASLREAKSPAVSLKVEFQQGKPRTLLIGRVARTVGSDDLRYAKIDDYPLIFELKADKLNDLNINLTKTTAAGSPIDDLRDSSLGRFDESEVTGIEISSSGEKNARPIHLEKTGDDWKMVQPVADSANRTEITELLNQLKGLEARPGSIIDGTLGLPQMVIGGFGSIDPRRLLGLTPDQAKKVTLTFDAKSGHKPRTYWLGVRDAGANKRAVMVDGWGRINIVDDRAEAGQISRLDRQPSSYRTLKLFDPLSSKISEVVVNRAATGTHAADGYSLVEQTGFPPKWSITAPFKAETDATATSRLASELGNLGSQKYVYDPKTDAPIKFDSWPALLTSLGIAVPMGENIFGFDPPALTVTLKFAEPKGAEDIAIEIGRHRSDTEYYARLKGTTGVFVVSDRVVKAVDQTAEDLVDKTLIQFAIRPEVQAIRRSMAGQEFELTQNNSAQWEVTKPVLAKADQAGVDELAQSLGQLRAVRIAAVAPKSLKEYGLEPPVALVTVEALEKAKLVEKVLLIGNPVDAMNPKGERFVKAQGSPMVAVLSGPLSQRLLAEPQHFRDLSLGGFVTADKLIEERGDRRITFVKGAGGWKVKDPLDTDAEDTDLRELHDLLAKLRAEELVEDKPNDLTKYGLDKPIHWRVVNGDREVMHLLVGLREKVGADKKIDGHRVYAMLDKAGPVVLLDPLLTSRLLAEYRKRAQWESVEPMLIKEVAIKAPDAKGSFTLIKGPAGWIDPQSITDRLNGELVNDLLLALGSLRAERYVVDRGADLAKFGLDRPRVVTITADDGKKRSLLIGNLLDGKQLYAKLDDPSRTDVFLLNETDSASLNRPRAPYSLIPKKEEPKKEEPTKEEPKKNEPKKEVPKKIAPPKDDFKKSPDVK